MNKKIRIVFLYRGLNFWLNNHSFYKECLWDGKFDIWVVPESNYIDPETLSMLKNDKVRIIEKNIKNGECFDLRRLNPDYVLIATPYKEQRNKIYNADYLQKFTKVLYIPYGPYVYDNYTKLYVYNGELPQCYKIFLSSQDEIKCFEKFLKKYTLVCASHPIYDLFNKKYNSNFIKKANISDINSNIKTILWTPHWSIRKIWVVEDNKNMSGNSDFVKYANLWLKIPKRYPNINFIMRPHPSLFDRLPNETGNVWTKEKVEEWKKEFTNNSNARIDCSTNYITQFLSSDAIINSSLSFTNVLINTGKPVLDTKNENHSIFQKSTQNIEDSYYKASTEQDIINFIENVVLKGNDTKLNDRKKALEENIHIPESGSGLFIKNFVENDFAESIRKSINIKKIFKEIYDK